MIGLAIASTLSIWTLSQINAEVNASHVYGELCATCGSGRWTCKDYAQAKLERLVAAGADPSKVTLQLVDIGGEPARWHVVVVVNDGIAMDNRFRGLLKVRALKAHGYAFRGTYRGLDSRGWPIREALHARGGPPPGDLPPFAEQFAGAAAP